MMLPCKPQKAALTFKYLKVFLPLKAFNTKESVVERAAIQLKKCCIWVLYPEALKGLPPFEIIGSCISDHVLSCLPTWLKHLNA